MFGRFAGPKAAELLFIIMPGFLRKAGPDGVLQNFRAALGLICLFTCGRDFVVRGLSLTPL